MNKIMHIAIVVVWLAIGLWGRLIPHLPSLSPLVALALLAARPFSRRVAVAVMLMIMVLSDVMLASGSAFPIWGSWTVFTYSGVVAIVMLGENSKYQASLLKLFCYGVLATLGFWLWTNFGTWVSADMYPKTLSGFLLCYWSALPFLRHGLLASVVWLPVLWILLRCCGCHLAKASAVKAPLAV